MSYILAIDAGKSHLGYALYDRTHLKFGLLDIDAYIKTRCAMSIPTQRIRILYYWFKALLNKYSVSRLVVEKQVKANVICMEIQVIVMTLAQTFDIPITLFDPKLKFSYISVSYDSKRKEHKKIATQYALNIIHNLGLDDGHFKTFKKQDDISDATCMAVMCAESDDVVKFLITQHI